MSSPGLPPTLPIPRFDNTLGALLIGGLVASALWGITCVQSYTFFTSNTKDSPLFKLLVFLLWALDTFDSCLHSHVLYYYMVSNYLNPQALLVPIWSVILHVAITLFSNFIIRSLFARRVYRLSHGNIPLTAWIIAVSMTDLVSGLVISVKTFSLSSYAALDTLANLMYLCFAAGTISDLSVAVSLCYLLHTSRTGFPKTDTIINLLMQYTVNTGLIVAIDAAAGMFCYIAMPHNLIFLGFYLLLNKLYLNSYLAALNAREAILEKIDEPVSIHLSDISRRFTSPQSQDTSSPSSQTFDKMNQLEGMKISVEVHRSVDGHTALP